MMSKTPTTSVFNQRRAGILLHPTSLPGEFGNGQLGAEAFSFVDFLTAAGIRIWQMLPLGPTHADYSPYQCTSVHAGNPRLISLQRLVEWGWLDAITRCEAECTEARRAEQLSLAYAGFLRQATDYERADFADFKERHSAWLNDFSLYEALRAEQQHRGWFDWEPALRDRQPDVIAEARRRLTDQCEQSAFNQYVFFKQWHALHDYANEHGVWLFGDVPIFVAYDSADVWARRDCFRLDAAGRLEVVAGVPPDYFSATGQRWGNPHYRWDQIERDGFGWWIDRMRTQRELFDLIRIDHFRGFEAFWEIPAAAETAIDGHWVKAPGERLFQALQESLHDLPLVAEDLGIITPEVDELRQRFGLPGMKILQFAFGGGADNPYLPHHHEALSVVYTGTHDNDTTVGWYQSLDDATRAHVHEYLGHPTDPMPWPLIRAAFASVASLAIIPLQDALALGGEHRMNTPGVAKDNWRWRFSWEQMPEDLAGRLRQLVELYGRQ